jgi:hypothetical protein
MVAAAHPVEAKAKPFQEPLQVAKGNRALAPHHGF